MPRTTSTSRLRPSRRGRTTLLTAGVAGLATLVLAGCGSTDAAGTGGSAGGDRSTPATGPATSPGTEAPTALALPDGSEPAGACAVLTPETLAAADTAFSATVTTVGDVVVLSVDTVYAGDPGTRVSIPRPADGLPNELSIGTPVEGDTYLISTQEDTVLTCGRSGPATPELQVLYDAAH